MLESQRLKAEIIATLDRLSLDRLKLLAEFVAFLRTKVDPVSTPVSQSSSASLNDNSILQLGTNPINDEVTDASVNHDRYLYSE